MEKNENNKRTMETAGNQSVPKHPISLVKVVGDSLEQWAKKDNGDRRSYILIGLCESEDDTEPDERQLFLGMGGSKDSWINSLVGALQKK